MSSVSREAGGQNKNGCHSALGHHGIHLKNDWRENYSELRRRFTRSWAVER
jgi:hypothetical protein